MATAPHLSPLAAPSRQQQPVEPPPAKTKRGRAKTAKTDKPRRETGPSRKRERDYEPTRFALRSVDGYLTRSREGITAWFVEPPQAWSMRSQHARENRIQDRAIRYAELGERGITDIHQRVVHRPWPVREWAENFDKWSHSGVTEPLPDAPDALSWREFVVGEQRAQLRRPTTSKSVYWGVSLSKRSGLAQALEGITGATSWAGPIHRVMSRRMDDVLDRELSDLADELRDITGIMRAAGIGARPATAEQMQYLLWRSATLGLPAPRLAGAANNHWDGSDLAALVDAAEITAEPLAGCVQVSGIVAGERFTRYVSILTVGRMGELAIPEQSLPWQVWGDAFGAVEHSTRLRIPTPEAVRQTLDRQINRIINQDRHITVEHDLPRPPDLEVKLDRAAAIRHEIEHDHTKLTTRLEGWWRMAVAALTPEEALQRAEALRKRYSPQIELEIAEGQYRQYLEFMPHESLSSTAYRRRCDVRLAAAAFPSVTDRIGDRHGPNIGETASLTRRPVNWDMWFAQEKLDKSGLTPVVGGLGAGKTHFSGVLVYKAVRCGAFGIVLDPSGPLRRLAELPELKPFTRLVDLMEAPPGTLNPYRVIVDPPRDDYERSERGTLRWESDIRATAAERKTFVGDVLRMLLPWDMQQSPHVRRAMDKAVDVVGGEASHEPGEVILALEAIAADPSVLEQTREAAEDTARKLNELRPHRQVRLLFPQPGIDGWASLDDARLTILTMPGVQLPKADTDPGTWSLAQRLGVPLMHLASWLTHRLIYETPRAVRKVVFLDEGKYLSGSGAGQMLYQRLERDTRKYNVRALIASQLPDDFLDMPGFEALTHEVIVGSLEGEKAQAGAVKLLRLPADGGWESVLNSLNSGGGTIEATHDPDALAAQNEGDGRPREYVMRIGSDVEIIRVDYTTSPHLAHVVDILNSRPTADPARVDTTKAV